MASELSDDRISTTNSEEATDTSAGKKASNPPAAAFDYSYMLEHKAAAGELLTSAEVENVLDLPAGSVRTNPTPSGSCNYEWTSPDGMPSWQMLRIEAAGPRDFQRILKMHQKLIDSGMHARADKNDASHSDYFIQNLQDQQLIVYTAKCGVTLVLGFTGGPTSRARFQDATDEQFALRRKEAGKIATYLMERDR